LSTGRAQAPPAGEPRPFRFPEVTRATLGAGMAAVLVPSPRVPLLTLALLAPAGGQLDPPGRAGLASLTAALRDEGTSRRDAMAIAAAIERLGGELGSSADWDASYLAAAVLGEHLGTALELLAEMAHDPSFPPSEVERLRRQRLAEILARRAQPAATADERFLRAVYGRGPYAWTLSGDEQTVSAIAREDILAFQRRHFAAAPWTLIAVGDFAVDRLLAQAAAVFASRAVDEVRPAAPPPPPFPEQVAVHLVDRSGAPQTELRIGHLGIPRRHPDHVPLTVLNTLLGGKFTSRINLNLRERHGYTYGAFSRFAQRLGAGPFVVSTAVDTQASGAAVREVLAELRRLRREPVSADELAETQSYLVGVFPYTVQTGADVARRLEDLVVFDLPSDYYETYFDAVRSVVPADLERVALEHLHPDRATVVAVGPAEELRPQLEELGPVSIEPAPPRAG
jgi:zinc protease